MAGTHISVMSVPVSDVDRARAFYTDVLGFELVRDNTFGDGMRWVQLRPPGGSASITLVTWFETMRPGSLKGTVLSVPDIEAARAGLAARGATVTEVQEAPWGRWVTLDDPDGNGWVVQEDRAEFTD